MKTPLILIAILAATSFAAEPQQQQQAAQQPQRAAAPQQQPQAQRTVPQRREIPNKAMDYPGFIKTALEVEKTRAERRVTEEQFIKMAAEPGTIVLDARSADKYALLHAKGAVSLPFTDFTAESLATVIPGKHTRVLIYCNNNFESEPRAFPEKRAEAALNISTFISLTTYGYDNIYELGPKLDVTKAKIEWAGKNVPAPR